MLTALLMALGLYAGLLALMYLGQARLVFIPNDRTLVGTPGERGLPHQEVWLATADGERLHAWRVGPREARFSLIHCHGNAGNISHRLDLLEWLVDLGLEVLIFDYRGYGRSGGRPSEASTYQDARAAWDWLTGARGRAPERILLHGHSLGAAVALELATQVPARALILEAPFTSVPDLGAELYPWLPVRRLARIQYDNRARVGRLSMPLLLMHSPQDEIIPFRHGQTLYAAAPQPKRFLSLRGGHNEAWWLSRDAYRQELRAFMDDLERGL